MERQVRAVTFLINSSAVLLHSHLERQKAESHIKLNQVLFNIVNEVFVLYE